MKQNRRRTPRPEGTRFWSKWTGGQNASKPGEAGQPEGTEPDGVPQPSERNWQWADLTHHLPFILYGTLLLLLYIANAHNQESVQRRIIKTQREIEDLKAEYILLHTEVMQLGRRNQVFERLRTTEAGWVMPQVPPIPLDSATTPTPTQPQAGI